MFGVIDDTTTTKFVNRACAVHGISLPVVVDKVIVVVLKFPIIELRDFIPLKSSLHYYFVQLRSLFRFILVVSKVIYVSLVCSILKKEGMWCIFSIAYMIYECTKVHGIDY